MDRVSKYGSDWFITHHCSWLKRTNFRKIKIDVIYYNELFDVGFLLISFDKWNAVFLRL